MTDNVSYKEKDHSAENGFYCGFQNRFLESKNEVLKILRKRLLFKI